MIKQRHHKETLLINGVWHVNAKVLGNQTGLGEWYLRKLAREDRIPCHKIGSKVWFDPTKVRVALKLDEKPKQLEIDWEGISGF